MNQIHLSGRHIIVHELPVGRLEEGLARGALVIAEHFHNDGRAFGPKSLVWIYIVHPTHGFDCARLPLGAMRSGSNGAKAPVNKEAPTDQGQDHSNSNYSATTHANLQRLTSRW